MRYPYTTALSAILIVNVLFSGCNDSNVPLNDTNSTESSEVVQEQSADDTQIQKLQRNFKEASAEFEVPVELLQVMAYYASNWQKSEIDTDDNESEHDSGLLGIMALSENQLQEASSLLGLEVDEIIDNDKDSIRAVAALMHTEARKLLGDDYASKTTIGDFFEIVGYLSGSDDLVLEQYFSEEIYETLLQGYRVKLSEDESVDIAALDADILQRSYRSSAISSDYLYKNNQSKQRIGQAVADSYIAAHSRNYTSTSGRKVKRIIIHTIEGSSTSAINWFRNSAARVSAHYIISKSGRITQMVKEKDKAYHAKYHNSDTIGLEHSGYASRGDFTSAEYTASFKLICDIAKRHNIPVDREHILGHGELTHNANRYDPGKYWAWDRLISEVDECVNGTNEQADLEIEDIWWTPETPVVGDSVVFHTRVKNLGGATKSNVGVSYKMDGEDAGWGAQGPLASKAVSEDFDLRESTWVVPSYGVFNLEALVDDSNIISESNEANNIFSKKLVVNDPNAKADVIIESLSFTPQDAKVGDVITFHAKVKNQGNAATEKNVGIAFYVDGLKVDWGATTVLEAGESFEDIVSRDTNWSLSQMGEFTLSALVDDNNILDESNEANNAFEVDMKFIPPEPSDLIVEKLWMTPEEPQENDIVTLHAKVKNQGKGDALSEISMAFSLNNDEVGFSVVDGIKAGESSEEFSLDIRWKRISEKTFSLKAWVDDAEKIDEGSVEAEENNHFEAVITNPDLLHAPDVIITKLWWTPTEVYVGDSVTLHVNVQNQGDESTGANVGVGYFLNGASIGYGARTAMLANSSSDDFDLTRPFKASAAGEFEIKAYVDDLDRFIELDDSNNIALSTLKVLSKNPDLIIEDMWFSPSEPKVGDEVKLYVKVKNSSSFATSNNVGVAFYLKGEKIGFAATTTLAANKSVELEIRDVKFKVPSAGVFEFSALVNDEKSVVESNYENNTFSKTLHVKAELADVVVEDIWWSPASPKVGEEVTFYARVKNSSDFDTKGNVGLAYFIDGEKVGWGATSIMKANSVSEEFTLRESKWIAKEGVFTFSAEVNDGKVFEESDIANNTFSKTLSIGSSTGGSSSSSESALESIDYVSTFPEVNSANYFKAFDTSTVLYSKVSFLAADILSDMDMLIKITVPAGVNEVIIENSSFADFTYSATLSENEMPAKLCSDSVKKGCFDSDNLLSMKEQLEFTRDSLDSSKPFYIYLHVKKEGASSNLSLEKFSTLMIVEDEAQYEAFRTTHVEGAL